MEEEEYELLNNLDAIDTTIVDTCTLSNIEPVELIVGQNFIAERLKGIFPKCIRYMDLRITDVGLYSVTRREESYFITNLIVKYYDSPRRFTITDSTSGVGGNGISFLIHPGIEHVHFVEINPLHVSILKHNIQLYGCNQKATVYQGNFLEIGPKLEQNVIFHDFPWGGNHYRDAQHLRIGLCKTTTWSPENWVPIEEIVNEYRPRTQMQVCKVPINFAFRHFFEKIEFSKIRIHKVYNRFSKKLYYYLIFLFS